MPPPLRTYHELTDPDRSGLAAQIGAQRRRVAERLATVRRVVAVMSGKGGVGKSYVTAGLARALARADRAVGVLDADLNGPTVARLLDAQDGRLAVQQDAVLPVRGADGVRLVSMSQVLEDGRPLAFRGPEAESHVWRGALEAAALREFLADVAWGALDWLLVDLPPGIGRFQELADLLPAVPAVLVVTIPTPESADAVRRAMRAARERGAPLLGVVENMAGPPYAGDAGAALAAEFAVPLLTRIPWHPAPDAWRALAERL
ncbi:MAG TPA: P-loop NTPase [Gemmatimonadales bacterium]|nr:P-loop NTPase [Gemmatimonadales bacterium]